MTLTLRNISHRFGDVLAVSEASLEAASGEIICLYGPSGCGKTTLLRLAAGLERLQKGEVLLDSALLAGHDQHIAAEERPIGVVFQDFVLFPHMTVSENIQFGLFRDRKSVKTRVTEQLRTFGINDLRGRYPHELSGGQQQRTALARAFIRRPRALLMDEPFASIDTALRYKLREELRATLKKQEAAVILVTHDPDEALSLGDRIALMRDGQIIETASPEDLYHKPQTADGAKIFRGSQSVDGVISDGRIETPLGVFEAPGLAAGPGVAVIRDGAMSARCNANGAAVVADARFIGPRWMLSLRSERYDELLRVVADEPIALGARCDLDIDLEKLLFLNQWVERHCGTLNI